MDKLPVLSVNRIRMKTDGEGVTTLIISAECSLRCKMCLNACTWDGTRQAEMLTCEELYDRVKIDHLYFLTTNGGLTFGGGEPLLYADFISSFINKYKELGWRFNMETSLNVPWEQILKVIDCIDYYIIDCKDMDETIYEQYTGGDGKVMKENLSNLLKEIGPNRIKVRVPLIPNYNSKEQVYESISLLRQMGITNIDAFTYVDPVKWHAYKKK